MSGSMQLFPEEMKIDLSPTWDCNWSQGQVCLGAVVPHKLIQMDQGLFLSKQNEVEVQSYIFWYQQVTKLQLDFIASIIRLNVLFQINN